MLTRFSTPSMVLYIQSQLVIQGHFPFGQRFTTLISSKASLHRRKLSNDLFTPLANTFHKIFAAIANKMQKTKIRTPRIKSLNIQILLLHLPELIANSEKFSPRTSQIKVTIFTTTFKFISISRKA